MEQAPLAAGAACAIHAWLMVAGAASCPITRQFLAIPLLLLPLVLLLLITTPAAAAAAAARISESPLAQQRLLNFLEIRGQVARVAVAGSLRPAGKCTCR